MDPNKKEIILNIKDHHEDNQDQLIVNHVKEIFSKWKMMIEMIRIHSFNGMIDPIHLYDTNHLNNIHREYNGL